MFLTLASFLLPPLFVFGVYHLLTWFNVFHINRRVFWKRVGLTSAVCHILLVSGFFIFGYLDAAGAPYGVYLFDRSNFWQLATIFDTAPMLVTVGLFAAFARGDVNPPGLVGITIAIIYVIGTLQWFLLGGAVGALLERFFEGLKTPEPEDDEFL